MREIAVWRRSRNAEFKMLNAELWCASGTILKYSRREYIHFAFSILHSAFALCNTSVKSWIFAQSGPYGKKHGGRKSGKKGIWGRRDLCKSVLHIHKPHLLWKTPVEKAVENVENSQFSTGIWLPGLHTAPCGKLCIPVCIKQITNRLQKRYVTVHQP